MIETRTLRVCETFTSIQGESSYAGYPCFFIRLSGCNLSCSYCDTEYARTEGEDLEIGELIKRATSSGIKLVEITGGEPLLQSNCIGLVTALLDSGFRVLVETNGSQDITPLDPRAIAIMDIKTPGSGMSDKMDFKNLYRLRSQDEIKFVITSKEDFLWSMEIINRYSLSERKVLLSPAYQRVEPAELAAWMIEEKTGARLNLQLHKIIFGDRRGV